MIYKLIILLILFFILGFTIINYSKDNFQNIGSQIFGNQRNMQGNFNNKLLMNRNVRTRSNTQNKNNNCSSFTNDAACDANPNCYYDYVTNNCNRTQTSDGDNCHLSVASFSCSLNDNCKWNNGKCVSSKNTQKCSEIKNEVDCNNSSLNCIYDNSSSKCFNQTNDLSKTPELSNTKNRHDYDYSDRNCNTLRKRGHNVYCTYDENNINDESLYFNLDKVIDTDKKRYKTCYGNNCINIPTTQSMITDSGCGLSKNRITCDLQDHCEYINYQCVSKSGTN